MRKAKYFGKTLRFPDDDWEALLDRFNSKSAVFEKDTYYIKKVSPLCKKYQIYPKGNSGISYECSPCPFSVFREKTGCIEFIDLLKPSFREIIYCLYDEISWHKEDDYKARQILKDLRKHLFKMEKT